jgi:hypothetical protein
MKIKTIEASLSVESKTIMGNAWRGRRIVAELEKNDDEDICQKELNTKLEKWLSYCPDQQELPKEQIEVRQIGFAKEEPLTQSQKLIRDIGTCTELKVLQSYLLLAKNNPEIKSAYDLKEKELQK